LKPTVGVSQMGVFQSQSPAKHISLRDSDAIVIESKKLKYLKKSYKIFCTFILKNTQIFEFLCAISHTAGHNKSDVFTTEIFF
jgi:hypothetical protein